MPCRGVQGAVEQHQPPLVREGLGDVRLGFTHQALELLTRGFDVGPVDRVRLPAPAVAVVGQVDGPAAREDGGAPRRHLVEAGRFDPIDEHRSRRPASRQTQAHVAVGAGSVESLGGKLVSLPRASTVDRELAGERW